MFSKISILTCFFGEKIVISIACIVVQFKLKPFIRKNTFFQNHFKIKSVTITSIVFYVTGIGCRVLKTDVVDLSKNFMSRKIKVAGPRFMVLDISLNNRGPDHYYRGLLSSRGATRGASRYKINSLFH